MGMQYLIPCKKAYKISSHRYCKPKISMLIDCRKIDVYCKTYSSYPLTQAFIRGELPILSGAFIAISLRVEHEVELPYFIPLIRQTETAANKKQELPDADRN